MRKIVLVLISFISLNNCKAQTIGLEDMGGYQSGVYYKDLNNVLNNFEGNYLYTNGTTSFEMILQKKISSNRNNVYTEDILIGGYKYVYDGNELINTLNSLGTYHSDGSVYSVCGNIINEGKYRCSECDVNEKWIDITIKGVNHVHNMYVRKKNLSGLEVIEIYILPAEIPSREIGSSPFPEAILPVAQWITLIKQ